MEQRWAASGQDNRGLDTSQYGPQVEPSRNKSKDRPYSQDLGLRSKACPPSRRENSQSIQIEGTCQGQVERCLALLCTMQQTPRKNASSGSDALSESTFGTPGMLPSQVIPPVPLARPGQSPCRDRTKSGWDVFPAITRCEKPCFMCNRPLVMTLMSSFVRSHVGIPCAGGYPLQFFLPWGGSLGELNCWIAGCLVQFTTVLVLLHLHNDMALLLGSFGFSPVFTDCPLLRSVTIEHWSDKRKRLDIVLLQTPCSAFQLIVMSTVVFMI